LSDLPQGSVAGSLHELAPFGIPACLVT